jgi:RHS repeat-associated protein
MTYPAKYSYLNDGRVLQKHEGAYQDRWGNYIYEGVTNKLSYIDSAGTQTHNLIYDNNGNMVFDLSKKMAIEYDWRNMPVKFTIFSSISGTISTWQDVVDYITNNHDLVTSEVVMTYDASGNRVKKEEFDYSSQTCNSLSTSDPGLLVSYISTGSTDPQSRALISTAGNLRTCLPVSSGDDINPIPISALTVALLENGNPVKTLSSFSDTKIQFGAPVITSSVPKVDPGSFVASYKFNPKFVNNIDYVAFAGTLAEEDPNAGVAYIDGSHIFVKNSGEDLYGLSCVNFDDGISRPDNSFESYLKDHLGSTRAVMAENAAYGWMLKETMAYLAYGTKGDLSSPPAGEWARRGFTGKELDEDVGIRLDYFGARYYDPELGVWISRDKAGQLYNPYGYATNPVIMVDPDGNFVITSLLIAMAWGVAIGASVSAATYSIPAAIKGNWNWSDFGKQVGLGALGGAVTAGFGSLGSSIATNMFYSAIGNAASYGLSSAVTGQEMSMGGMGAALLGGLAGGLMPTYAGLNNLAGAQCDTMCFL